MTKNASNKKFLIFSEFGELLDLAIALQNEGHEVLMHIPNSEQEKIGDGIVKKEKQWWNCIGKDYIWLFDGCSNGSLVEWLRSRGEIVFGGTEDTDRLENDRQLGQALFKAAGFIQPFSKNFKNIAEAIDFVERNKNKKYILKQNGNAPKSLNHMGKFDGSEDMLHHLKGLQKSWNEASMGEIDFDLMEVVTGLELAASAFFNGTDWMRDDDGKVTGYLNFEEKKEMPGGLGETTGEMGTTFITADEDNELFRDMILRPKITETLRALNYRGVFDINCIKTDKGIVALEPTMRFGVPATSYEFIEGLDMPIGNLISSVARGENPPISLKKGVGMVMVIAAKPFPVEAHLENEHTSLGEKLWILDKGKIIGDFTDEQKNHVHLANFEKKDDAYYVATSSGYLLTVTGHGDNIKDVRESLIQYIKDNLYISGMKYRTDIGARIEDAMGTAVKDAKKVSEKEAQKKLELKNALKDAIYGTH